MLKFLSGIFNTSSYSEPAHKTPTDGAVISIWREPPSLASNESPILHVTDSELVISYLIAPVALENEAQEECAIVKFKQVSLFTYGYPNDEALGGHPLAKFGLNFYEFNIIKNSPKIKELREQNAISFPNYKSQSDSKHFVVTFQDKTLEVICQEAVYVDRHLTDDRKEALKLYLSQNS